MKNYKKVPWWLKDIYGYPIEFKKGGWFIYRLARVFLQNLRKLKPTTKAEDVITTYDRKYNLKRLRLIKTFSRRPIEEINSFIEGQIHSVNVRTDSGVVVVNINKDLSLSAELVADYRTTLILLVLNNEIDVNRLYALNDFGGPGMTKIIL